MTNAISNTAININDIIANLAEQIVENYKYTDEITGESNHIYAEYLVEGDTGIALWCYVDIDRTGRMHLVNPEVEWDDLGIDLKELEWAVKEEWYDTCEFFSYK